MILKSMGVECKKDDMDGYAGRLAPFTGLQHGVASCAVTEQGPTICHVTRD